MQEVPVPTDAPALPPRDGEKVALVHAGYGDIYGKRAVVARSRLAVANVQASRRRELGLARIVGRAPAGAADRHRATVGAAQKFKVIKEAVLKLNQPAPAFAPEFRR